VPVRVAVDTEPFNEAIVHVTTAPIPPPPEIDTVGADVYPAPPLASVTLVITPPESTANPAAPVPPPPENCTLGALV
jgi:hypothetical protein